jgi:REP element-mobilizing transposase RayT
MNQDPTRHHRRSLRLPAYDYAQAGAYFVTMVAHQRQCLFGEIVDGRVVKNGYGEAVEHEWFLSSEIRPGIQLDAFVVMPNHVHGIVIIGDRVGAHSCAPLPSLSHGRAPLRNSPSPRPPRSLGSFIAGFKSAATKRINEMRRTPGNAVWQRNYYEHVIRDERELDVIRQYCVENPLRWAEDRENPDNVGEPNVGAHGRAPLHGRAVLRDV